MTRVMRRQWGQLHLFLNRVISIFIILCTYNHLCFTMWPRFVPGTLGWRHSSAEMLFILMEGGSSGKARCSLSIYLLEKSFESFFVPGHWGAKWLCGSDGNWRDGEKHQNSDQAEEQVEPGGFETDFCVNKNWYLLSIEPICNLHISHWWNRFVIIDCAMPLLIVLICYW